MTELHFRGMALAPAASWRWSMLATLACALALPAAAQTSETAKLSASSAPRLRNGDYIAVVVNQELVTAGEIDRRVERAVADAGRNARLPPEAELRRQALDLLIEERVMISNARETGVRIDEPEVERAIQSIAAQNQIPMAELRKRIEADGTDYGRFRVNIREQLMMERLREREVNGRIRIADEDIDRYLAQQRAAANVDPETNLAQILVTVPEGSSPADEAKLRAKADAALARVKAGEDFGKVAREISEDANRAKGGEIGLRPTSKLPDIFVEATRDLKDGEVTAQPLRSGAGFHILKVVERKSFDPTRITQTRARHVLLRTSPQLTTETAVRRLGEYRRDIETGKRTFEDTAKQYSEDGSAAQGGDLGWASPGMMVPEFENAMNELALNGLSQPVVSRFGVHLIQVLERRQAQIEPKQLRDQARAALREQRFEQAYLDWAKELRNKAYVEYREPPQ